jgi:hypothetical protein
MSISKPYFKTAGFTPVGIVKGSDITWVPCAAVAIAKGAAVFDNGSGYGDDTATAFALTFLGIALAAVDNSAGSAGDLYVPVITPGANMQFWVPCAANDAMAQTDVGTVIDLEANATVDNSDTTCTAWGFLVEAIDISTDAVDANTYGYAKGRFIKMTN